MWVTYFTLSVYITHFMCLFMGHEFYIDCAFHMGHIFTAVHVFHASHVFHMGHLFHADHVYHVGCIIHAGHVFMKITLYIPCRSYILLRPPLLCRSCTTRWLIFHMGPVFNGFPVFCASNIFHTGHIIHTGHTFTIGQLSYTVHIINIDPLDKFYHLDDLD